MASTKKKSKKSTSKIALAKKRITKAGQTFQHLKLLAYGKNGAGKTRLGASGPKPIIIDCNEKGTLSIRKFPDVQVFRVETWTDIDLAYWYLHGGDHDRQTVVIDTITSLAQLCMKFVLGDEASRDPTKDPDMPSRREWGKVGELMKTQILQFRNLPFHVVFLAQERRGFSEEEEEAPEVFPEVSPSIRSTLTAAVDIIGRMYVREVVVEDKKPQIDYRMMVGPSEVYVTKDRSEAGLPSIIRMTDSKDNLTRLISRIRKGEK